MAWRMAYGVAWRGLTLRPVYGMRHGVARGLLGCGMAWRVAYRCRSMAWRGAWRSLTLRHGVASREPDQWRGVADQWRIGSL